MGKLDQAKKKRASSGFSLIEVMIAMAILSVGMLGLLALFAQAVAISNYSSDDLLAKQVAREALESIYTARNTNRVTFSMIRNASSGGIFADGYQPLRSVGDDGLAGTADDGEVQSMKLAGKDGRMGTEDDEVVALDNYERKLAIEEINEDLRKVVITVRYQTAGGAQRDYEVQCYISRFR